MAKVFALACVAVGLLACEGRTDKVDGGGVLLSVQDFDGLPAGVGVNAAQAAGIVTIDSITIESIVRNPSGGSSDLMTVEMESYEVTFTRADTGTRVPPPVVRRIFGSVRANGTIQIDNLPIMTAPQLENTPLSDLLLENGGVDQETGSDVIVLNVRMRFFGRTLSGDEVDTAPITFTVEFRP